MDMQTYHQKLETVTVNRERRKEPSSLLNPQEIRKLKGLLGSLQWLVAQVRFDLGFGVSSLQSEKPTVGTLLRANRLVLEAKKHMDFKLTFKDVNPFKGGILVVTDAALGNVTVDGTVDAPAQERVHSQACYAVLLADEDLMQGKAGKFNILDFRSHRLARVSRSSYASETLSAEEGLDSGELCRGFIAELKGLNMASKTAYWDVCRVPMLGCTDAKDVFDRLSLDTGFGTQKSLAFTVAALRQQLRRPNTGYRWTATANLFVDAGTKVMDNTALRQTLLRGEWSIEFNESFTKQTYKKKKPEAMAKANEDDLQGRLPEGRDEGLMKFVYQLSELSGWHYVDETGVNVARNAKSLRSPAPRFAIREFPYRTTVVGWRTGRGVQWRILEEKVDLRDIPNHQEQLQSRAHRLVTFFSRGANNGSSAT